MVPNPDPKQYWNNWKNDMSLFSATNQERPFEQLLSEKRRFSTSIPILVSCTLKTRKFKLLYFRNETCFGAGNLYKDSCFIYLQPSVNKNSWELLFWLCNLMTSLWKPSIVPLRNHSTERLGLKNGWTCTLKCKPPSSKWWTTNQDFTRHFNGHLQHLAWPRLSTSASLNTTKTGVWVWNTVADIVRLFSILWSHKLSSFEQNFLEFSSGTVLLHTKVVLAALRF